ncbi:hypothetical protein [Polymorphospora lycopeni]|uniref:Uncharacterized protein n=1 Tax=Polymorphospora lycopeni TaxID=3140240 RepID=A0ABV5CKZ2_9ACTN
MSGWTLRVLWPVEDPDLYGDDAIRLAEDDLPYVAARTGAVVTGEPVFEVIDCDADRPWPGTPTAVRCIVAAEPVPARAALPRAA